MPKAEGSFHFHGQSQIYKKHLNAFAFIRKKIYARVGKKCGVEDIFPSLPKSKTRKL